LTFNAAAQAEDEDDDEDDDGDEPRVPGCFCAGPKVKFLATAGSGHFFCLQESE
jgi:hypothetical protein